MKIYGAQPLRFCEGEAGRGSTTTRTGIFGDQVSSCRAKVLAQPVALLRGKNKQVVQFDQGTWHAEVCLIWVPKQGVLVLEPGLPTPRKNSWVVAPPTEELGCLTLSTTVPDWENLGVMWSGLSPNPAQVWAWVGAPPTTEHGFQSYMRGRAGKNTWRLPNPGTLEPTEGQAELATPWEKPLALYGQRTWGTERFESRLLIARLALNRLLSLYQGTETNF